MIIWIQTDFDTDVIIPERILEKVAFEKNQQTINTPGRRQSKTLFTIDKGGSKIDRNSVFNCHLSPVGQQKKIENCF